MEVEGGLYLVGELDFSRRYAAASVSPSPRDIVSPGPRHFCVADSYRRAAIVRILIVSMAIVSMTMVQA